MRLFFKDSISGQIYWRCLDCELIFLEPEQRLSAAEEQGRYEMHQNNGADLGYQEFVNPAVEAIRGRISPPAFVLDFGSGRSSSLSHLLKKDGYQVVEYDPFFKKDVNWQTNKYSAIAMIEVIEHMYDPRVTLQQCRNQIEQTGILVIMTALYTENIDFDSWYYRRDPTHVAFYSSRTFAFLGRLLGSYKVQLQSDRLITLLFGG